jgi:isoleucyl-tRNA synthetase
MYCLETLTKAIAPVLSHTAEDIWQYLPYSVSHKSVFQAGWLVTNDQWYKPELVAKWEYLREVRGEVNRVLESARTGKLIGAPLEAKVLLVASDATQHDYLASLNDELRYLFIVSQAELVDSLPTADFIGEGAGLQIAVVKADGDKCPRCWNYSTHIGESVEHPHICNRCVGAIAGTF